MDCHADFIARNDGDSGFYAAVSFVLINGKLSRRFTPRNNKEKA
jgi:hypothetical protein